jgi:hypothetical protein
MIVLMSVEGRAAHFHQREHICVVRIWFRRRDRHRLAPPIVVARAAGGARV